MAIEIGRRQLISALGGAAVAWPLAARAQQMGKVPRIGILNPGPSDNPAAGAFYKGLQELGYTEGQNIAIERRYGEWNSNRFHQLAAELVRLNVDVIVVMSTSSARAAKQATSIIPIVVASMADPVGDELVASLAQPGGNITGDHLHWPGVNCQTLWAAQGGHSWTLPRRGSLASWCIRRTYDAKLIERDRGCGNGIGITASTRAGQWSQRLRKRILRHDQRERRRSHLLNSPMLFSEHRRIVELAAKSRLPAMYAAREFADAGGLMSYGANLADVFRRAATYVDKILKGAKPADLPVEQPTKLELVINVKTARELGLTIPREFLLLADEVIE